MNPIVSIVLTFADGSSQRFSESTVSQVAAEPVEIVAPMVEATPGV